MNESKGITCKLLDGSEVVLSEGDRVLGLRRGDETLTITTDADSIIDEVLATLADAQREIEELKNANESLAEHARDRHTESKQWESDVDRLGKALDIGKKQRYMILKGGSPAIHKLGDIRREEDDLIYVKSETQDHFIEILLKDSNLQKLSLGKVIVGH